MSDSNSGAPGGAAVMDAPLCPRCSHSQHVDPPTTERLRRAVGLKAHRVQCACTTDLGPCACRSRFHNA